MPLFNEEGLVGPCIRQLPACVDAIVVVNDGSTDRSRREVAEIRDPRIVLLDTMRRSGPGRALYIGLRWASVQGATYVVTMDSDGQMSVRDLPDVLAPLEAGQCDYVKGTRFHPSVSRASMPWSRRLGNRVLSALAARLLGEKELKDAHCGYTAISGRLLRRIDLESLHSGYGVYVDILARVKSVSDARIAYVPVEALYGSERSHFRWRKAIYGYVRMIARIRRARAAEITRAEGAHPAVR
jgi:glycosyltransferase involved in cell wall biosynthesis